MFTLTYFRKACYTCVLLSSYTFTLTFFRKACFTCYTCVLLSSYMFILPFFRKACFFCVLLSSYMFTLTFFRKACFTCVLLSSYTFTLTSGNLFHLLHLCSVVKLHVHLAFLQELNQRAQGEVTIREAIRELELWGAGAVFSLTDYEDSSKNKMNLIKDWKDLVNQVSTYTHTHIHTHE